MYDKTDWRPSHWFYTDFPGTPQDVYKRDLRTHLDEGYDMFMWQLFRDDMELFFQVEAWEPRIHYLRFCDYHQNMDARSMVRPLEWHYEDFGGGPYNLPVFCKFCGTFNVMFQYAVWKEYNPLILLGIDADWEPRPTGSDDFNHFHPDYQGWMGIPTFAVANQNRDDALYSHQLNKKLADKKGISVYNATPGGLVESYERMDLEKCLELLK
jgi:hypothetical protein